MHHSTVAVAVAVAVAGRAQAADAAACVAAVVTMQATALTGPDTLAVHNGSAGSGITAELPPLVFTQRRQHPLPHAILLPAP